MTLAVALPCHTLRNSSATELLRRRTPPLRPQHRTLQELLGHQRPRTTMIYTDALDQGALGIASPLDNLPPASP